MQVLSYLLRVLIHTGHPMTQEQEAMRGFIIKHSRGVITSKDSIFFWYNKKLIDHNLKVSDFLKFSFKDIEKDGWLHLKVTTQ